MARKVVFIVLGIVLGLGGVLAIVAGAGILVLFGTNNTLESGAHPLRSSGSALLSPSADIQGLSSLSSNFGTPTLEVEARTTGPGNGVFVGVGPARQVDTYLTGASVTTITDLRLEPYGVTTQTRAGTATPPPPAQQRFWTAEATGSPTANLRWRVTTDGSYRVVVMRGDAGNPVTVQVRVGLTIPHIGDIGIGLLVGGVIVLIGGILLLVVGVRTRTGPPAPTTGWGPPPQQPGWGTSPQQPGWGTSPQPVPPPGQGEPRTPPAGTPPAGTPPAGTPPVGEPIGHPEPVEPPPPWPEAPPREPGAET